MKFDTKTAAGYAADKLDSLLERAQRDTNEVVQGNDIPTTVAQFRCAAGHGRRSQEENSALQKHLDALSYEILPTMFENQDVKTIKLDNVGRVTVNVRWSATMLDKPASMERLSTLGQRGT